ncbi:hypothetical protein BM735_09670 [Erysipelotrichaceae bacterium NYU-BL-F16]|uniref:Uncharacterized protein n=1 Tax=Ileibacterium valens TaxID=1862668 RepID=A0A1U7NIN3_9FIRM|nr:hypothetical protein BM735_12385 [Erysipelotrichaceae bacterium NYU-BL-F16]OLU38167.1 hypothetical protein BM735_09670 [Erysipelotrichaceae bacterium NYU-BL-F16]OLU39177.1 hypothetical protein BO222_07165 [Ileibacterium valens]OLU42496.1 hypothetical protein BO222_01510 [Ileibacterium valens]OLU42574.1 hypothetical protein BO222_01405 [Ileibacterium valens]
MVELASSLTYGRVSDLDFMRLEVSQILLANRAACQRSDKTSNTGKANFSVSREGFAFNQGTIRAVCQTVQVRIEDLAILFRGFRMGQNNHLRNPSDYGLVPSFGLSSAIFG